ncbi:hypothetical protein [Nocardia shimofusensis]|uniref:hypothetical protein n=1 Tax=Nocardia shimofusensis TaxID=228596 RepID=UPI0008325E1D|nr:hypothetical protein [Nocardia shimofusensis]
MSDNDVDPGSAEKVSSAAAATSGTDAASSGKGAGSEAVASGTAGGSEETVKTRKSGPSEETVKTRKSGPSEETVAAEPAEPAETVEVAELAGSEKTVKTSGPARNTDAAKTAAGAGATAPTSVDGSSQAAGRAKLVAAGSIGAIVLGAAVGAAGYFFVQNGRNEALLAAHEEARQAACDYAPRLADYDAKNLDAYFAAVLDGATGEWHEQFDDTSRELREVLTEGQVVSKVQHVECAIKAGDETSAEAVIMIGQTITSVGTQGQASPGQLSMVLRMEKSDGRWLVNQVDSPLPAPQQ